MGFCLYCVQIYLQVFKFFLAFFLESFPFLLCQSLWSTSRPVSLVLFFFYLLLSSSQRFRCFEWAHQCSRQRYCLKLSMNPVPLNIIEWHLFLLVVSALTNWFLSDWQLGLRCSRRTAAWTGDCSEAMLDLNMPGMYIFRSEQLMWPWGGICLYFHKLWLLPDLF